MHAGDSRTRKACRVCGFSSFDSAAFYEHLNVTKHGTQPKLKFKCSKCSQSFHDKASLKAHLTAENHWDGTASPEKPASTVNECSECHQRFDSRDRLKFHLKAEGHFKKPTETNPVARQPPSSPLEEDALKAKTPSKQGKNRPSSAPRAQATPPPLEKSASGAGGSTQQGRKHSFINADDSIQQVYSKLGLDNADELAQATIDHLGVGTAAELKEVFDSDSTLVSRQVLEALSQHSYFCPKAHSQRTPRLAPPQLRPPTDPDACRARLARQRRANLPIFSSRDTFLERLRAERVLIVTAATGSGKTTQLPQYAADDPAFAGGRVVCTQPRALAATSIAKRIGEEYDGPGATSDSVGYTVGGSKSKVGSRIQLMTDAALVRLAQREATLASISVLIIDEAHERSLNTDIVLAIAKLVLAKRPDDFYVVVASATIDERPFLQYFFGESPADRSVLGMKLSLSMFQNMLGLGQSGRTALQVPGKVFPISVEEHPIDLKKTRDYIPQLVDVVVASLRKQPTGHCLVFMPGQIEIDKAIKAFQTKRDTASWVPKALFGGLTHEQQTEVLEFDSDGGRLRMVCFCTNVAETSLTVPGIELVVDSGIAKEARYDVKRRMTVLEEVLVSKSSADQRKGRSGRTGPGHCVRLFEYDALPRDQIQPEILRASLDLVVLQLLTLGYDPRTFPFMDTPHGEDLENAFQLMVDFDCLDKNHRVTTFGHLLNALPFDPRMSKFVIDCFVQSTHEQSALKQAAEVAGILTAPGSLFFMGGGKGADAAASKAETKANISRQAADHSSDLLFLLQVYRDWQASGTNVDASTRTCLDCKKSVSKKGKDTHCRPCRSAHTKAQSLNQKILSGVDRTVDSVVRTILESNHFARVVPTTQVAADMAEIMGRALLVSFPEQVCQLILPHNPSEGVYLCALKQRAIVQTTSAICQKVGDKAAMDAAQFFVAYEVTKLPNGKFIADRLHPVVDTSALPRAVAESTLAIELCFERKPLHMSFMKELKKWFVANYNDHEILSGMAFEYADHDLAVRVYAPAPFKPTVYSLCATWVDARVNEMLAYELTRCIGNGTANLTVKGGLVTECLEPVGLACRIRLDHQLPGEVHNDLTFREWVVAAAKAKHVNVDAKKHFKWTNLYKSERSGVVVFTNQDVATRVLQALRDFTSPDTEAKGVFTALDEAWGRAVIFSLQFDPPSAISKQLLESTLGLQDVLTATVLMSTATKAKLTIKDLPTTTTKEELQGVLRGFEGCAVKLVPYPQFQSQTAYIEFASISDQLAAQSILSQSALLTTPYTKTYTNQSGRSKVKSVVPSMQASDNGVVPTSRVSVTFASSAAAELFTSTAHDPTVVTKVQGRAVVLVDKWDLFDGKALLAAIEQRFNVKAFTGPLKPGAKQKIEFNGASPVACGQAAQALVQSTAPSKVVLNDVAQQFLFSELHDSGDLATWATDLNVDAKLEKPGPMGRRWRSLVVHGAPVRQGEFMRRIGDAHDTFQVRFRQVPLGLSANLFSKGRVGDHTLNKLRAEHGNAFQIELNVPLRSMHMYARPGVDPATAKAILDQAEAEIRHVANEFGNAAPADTDCVYCHARPDKPHQLSICGHRVCQSCLESAVQDDAAMHRLPLRCRECATTLSVHDVSKNISIDAALVQSAQHYFKQHKSSELGMCPQSECCSFIALHTNNVYVKCPSCLSDVCVACGVVNAEMHRGITCDAFAEKLRLRRQFDLDALFADAAKFVQDNWTPKTGTPCRVEPNPNLEQGCLSLQRYLKGVRELGLNAAQALQASAMFVWHGTAEAAIAPICANGFDPSRRTGQAYGPGEYFGVNADVSLGYMKGAKRLIVAQVIRQGSHFKLVQGFCYVINNPRDWNLCYNLPVAVATYDPNLGPVQFEAVPQRCRPLGALLDEHFETTQPKAHPSQRVHAASTAQEATTWRLPFRWQWLDDKGKFQPYSDSISTLLESAYADPHLRSTTFTTPPIVRFLDDKPQEYLIDFPRMKQLHAVTKFARDIRRVKDDAANVKYVVALWQYESASNGWQRIEEVAQVEIEKAFRAYVDMNAPAQVTISVLRNRYEIDFAAGTQTNSESRTTRRIQRVDAQTFVAPTETVTLVLRRTSSALGLDLPRIRAFLHDRLERASGVSRTSAASNAVDLSVAPSQSTQVHVKMVLRTKLAQSMVAVLCGSLKSTIYAACGDVFESSTATGTYSQRMTANPRLAQLTYCQPPQTWHSRDDILLQIVHFVLWKQAALGCYVYGGFVRDWVLRGESANDVDVSVPSAAVGQTLFKLLVDHVCRHTTLTAPTSLEAKGSAMCLKFKDPLGIVKAIEIDLVDASKLQFVAPGVDCDAGNICLRSEGNMTKRFENAGGTSLPLFKCIRHCEKARFVFFYDLESNRDTARRRLEKYLKRQWTCLTPLPPSTLSNLPQDLRKYCKPKTKYTVRGGEVIV